jgi:hypothetical protein
VTADQETALAELAAVLTRWLRVEARTNRAVDGTMDDALTMVANVIAGEPPSDPGALLRGVTAWEAVTDEATAQLKRTLNRTLELDNGDEEYRAAVRAIIDPGTA